MLLLGGIGGISQLNIDSQEHEKEIEEIVEEKPIRKLKLLDFTADDLRNHVAEKSLLHEDARYFEKMESYFNYLSLDEENKYDPITSLYAVRNNSYNYLHVPEEIKSADFISACLFNNRRTFLYMTDEDKCKKGVLAYISVADEELFKHFPDYLKKSEQFWSSVVSINPSFIHKLDADMVARINKYRNKDNEQAIPKILQQAQQQQLAYEMKKKGK
ncbi:hypothetical protein [Aquitalea pelogenes]|uniref:hypothetical protein n=1 Tax=Aquitalea pelogenes TaxID=1293573 RepID=UPI0035B1C10A